jgi:formylglycine-generating enzyme required for sulfatase activity
MALLTLLLLLMAPAQSPPAQPISQFRDCRDCPEMVALPAGSFMMGSPDSEVGRDPAEGPRHRVTLPRFAIGRYDVTRREWAVFVADTNRAHSGGCAWAGTLGPKPDPAANWRNLAFQADDHPVVCITWADASDYARWLSKRTGHAYRLPTEAEWEYAARAGTATAFPWGDNASHDRANYGADACCAALAAGRDKWDKTSPVGAFPPNAFGLYDMHGNVLQWTRDCLTDYADPASGKAGPVNPGGPFPKWVTGDRCAYRMLRGGDWGDPPSMIRSAYRNFAPAPGGQLETYRSAGVGFRLVRALN